MQVVNNTLIQAIEFQQQGKIDEASSLFSKVLAIDPGNAAALYSLSLIAHHSGNNAEALRISERGVNVAPLFSPLHLIHGAVLQAMGRKEEALQSYDKALEISPNYVEVLTNSGVLLRDMLRHREALERFNHILSFDSFNTSALSNCGILLTEFKQSELAIPMFKQLISINPDYDYALGLLAYEQLHICDWTDFEALSKQITEGLASGRRSCKSLAFMSFSDSAEDHQRAAKLFSEQYCPKRDISYWQGERYHHKKIRLAYVSPDLREHPVGHLMAGVFERHDKSRFELTAISLGIDDGSRLRARMLKTFDHFIDAQQMSASQIAQTLREMEIDIAVDLAGYTSDSRADIFAHRPVPVQVNYLGYPGTMGTEYMDYILADRHVIPENQQQFYSEKVVYLPDSYLPTDSGIQIAERTPSREECGLPATGVVFCSFSHDYKILPATFAIWMRLLQQVPGSVLWLMSRRDISIHNLCLAAEQQGIDPARLIFATRVPLVEDHLARYRLADIFLDTHPYNAHTTAADALMAGLPVVTYMGNAFPARVAGSLLQAIGMPELIAQSLEEYEQIALRLVTTPELLADVKARLVANKATCALFDTERFTRNLEEAYIGMHSQTQNNESSVVTVSEVIAIDSSENTLLKSLSFDSGKQTNNVVILVPIYKDNLDPIERYALDHSLSAVSGRKILFIGSENLDRKYYSEHYPAIPFVAYDAVYFASVVGYNQLLLSKAFYNAYAAYEFMLILQTDAIVLKDDLDYWCAQPFDYVGAPWPDGYELFVNLGRFEGEYGNKVKVFVGNGGLSLRRVGKCLTLLDEFDVAVDVFTHSGSSEDLFFSVMGSLSGDFVIPNQMTAARFSLEKKPSYYYAVNGNKLPMGGHAWCKWEPEFWREHLTDMPLLSL